MLDDTNNSSELEANLSADDNSNHRALLNSEVRYRRLFESAQDGILIIDAATRKITDVNPFMVNLLGYSRSEFIGKELWEIGLLEDAESSLRAFQELQANGFIRYENMPLETRTGEPREVEFVSNVYTENTRQVIQCNIRDATERKRALKELRRKQANLESIIASVPGIVWESQLTPTTNASTSENDSQSVEFVSDYVETMIGYTVEEWSATPNFWAQILHPDDRERALREASELSKSGISRAQQHYRWIAKDGRIVWVESQMIVLYDESGKATGIRGVTIDVTDRREAEAALSATDERYRLLFERNPLPMWVYDLETLKFLAVNRAALVHYGYSREEFESMTIKDIRPSEFTPALLASVAKVKRGGIDRAGVWKHRKRDGSLIDVEITSHELLFSGRNAELVLANDITERKRAEDALSQEQHITDEIVDSLPGIFYLFDENLRYIRWNKNLEQVTGYAPAELAEMSPTDFFTEDEKELIAEKVGEALRSGESRVEANLRTKDGLSIPYIFSARRAVFDQKVHLMGTGIDISERKQLEEQLRLSQKLESVGRLAGGIAHDFNNMLTAINGFSDLTLRRMKEDDPLRHNIEEIKKAGVRSASLTHQLLAFSRQQILRPKTLYFNQIITDTSTMLRRLIGEDIQLITVLENAAGPVKADPGQLAQVIMNLAVNARDAMPRGGTLTIETGNVYLDEQYALHHVSAKPGEYVMLAVTDTGTGMDEQTQKQIFEPFFTTKGVGEGTGLGLATVYGVVKQSGGNIWVYSEIGVGTSFKIYLPRVAEKSDHVETHAAFEVMPRGTETLLIVEDEELVRTLLRHSLESCGYTVLEARDGVEALSVCEQEDECRIDLLITDVVMPRMGGRQLAEQLKQIHPNLLILFMSGYTDDAVVRHGMVEGETKFLQKPFSPEALARKIREILDDPQRLAHSSV